MSQKPAHVITERQKKGSLASVKKPKLPKNVLIRNETDYWPSLSEEQRESFVQLLETFCSGTEYQKHIAVGLESSLRHLKKPNDVKLLLIANEISPKWFGKHLIAMALSRNPSTKIIIVPALKEVTKKLLKVPSIVVIFKASANLSFLEEFYNRQLGIHSELLSSYYTIQPTIDSSVKKSKTKRTTIQSEAPVVLLKRFSDSCRSFVPVEADPEEPIAGLSTKDSSDFISLSKFSICSSYLTDSSASLYRPPKIMKLSGNPNRKLKSCKIKKT